jgi:hypothetical protein
MAMVSPGIGTAFIPSPFAAAGKSRFAARRCESCDFHEIATAWEIFVLRRLLPLWAMDRPHALR